MKPLSLILISLAAAAGISAQTLDLRSLADIRMHKLQYKQAEASSRPMKALRAFANGAAENSDPRTLFDAEAMPLRKTSLAFVNIADGFSADDLREAGLNVLSCYGSLAIVEVAIDNAEETSALPCIKSMSLQKQLSVGMDRAREASGVDLIHQGNKNPESGLSVPYTGRGVVTGIVDQGIDPHHINFRYIGGESRISYLAHLRYNADYSGMAETHYNYETIKDFTTDAPGAYHGTHTMGIMAGSYNGPVSVAEPWANPAVPEPAKLITENCKYYGVAPEADLAVSCGELADVFIAYGLDYILGYADYAKAPIVYNLSLGSSSGAHDPRSAMNQFLDTIGQRSIVCVSAGNEGDLKIALKKNLTESEQSFKTLIFPYNYTYDPAKPESFTARYGSVSIYSNDSTPFKLKAVIYNKKRNYRPAYTMAVVGDNIGSYYCSNSDYAQSETDIVGDPTFCKAFEGYVGVGSKIDEQTGRYYGMVDFYVFNNPETNLNDDYVLGFEVEGVPGQRIECYNDGKTTWLDNYGVEGFTDGSTDGSISDMAVGRNVLVVGSYNTRNNWVSLDGGTSRYEGDGFTVGGVSGFSSYGTMNDGTTLPHVCAPGAAIISSISWPYAQQVKQQAGEETLNLMCQAKLEEDGRVNYWKQEVGTSMSTPFVAGSIALWLEANPGLTIDDVKAIIAKTSVRDEQVAATKEQARWGAGKFNAIEGLKEAIRMLGVEGITTDAHNDRLILTYDGGRVYKVFVGTEAALDTRVFSADGKLVYHKSQPGDEMTVDLGNLTPGIYVINVNGRHSSKIAIR